MCLYPKLLINRKYIPNNKNGYNAPPIKDPRTLYVPAGCGKCMECRKQKSRQWSVRLQEHIRTEQHKVFITLTFSNESIKKLAEEITGLEGYDLDNEIATLAMRRFLERWRKKYQKSITHWMVTEIGQGETKADNIKLQGDGNIHLHGILFLKKEINVVDYSTGELKATYNVEDQYKDIEKIWKYGYVFYGSYVNESTVNYIVKYITKTDFNHKEYNPKILTSAGIGKNYLNRWDRRLNEYKINGETKETYTFRNGREANLPIYYRNHIYTDDQKEGLWIQKLNKQERWVNGVRVSTKNGEEEYYKLLMLARQKNTRLGYGNDEINWNRKHYEIARRKLNMKKRTGVELMDN